ncbi:DUF2802 domain-containing protein [Vibrio sp. TH_r3]|uniref:DUF2802 domain-containing protein n=1 Tax=Vibrio sp. TH_r3 TaxID=3082084 RepID=UPI0039882F2D
MLIVLSAGSVVFSLVIALWLLRVSSTLQKRNDQQRQELRSQEKELSKANNQLLEVRSVVIGLGQKMTEQQDMIQHLSERITELEHVDSDSRLYSRATKMVQLGAGVDELIQECELPKAEAELMMALQTKISGKDSVSSTKTRRK